MVDISIHGDLNGQLDTDEQLTSKTIRINKIHCIKNSSLMI